MRAARRTAVPARPARGRTGAARCCGAAALGTALLLLLPSAGSAQLPLWDGEAGSLELGGYLRTLSGVSQAALSGPETDRTTAFNAEVLRLAWVLRLGSAVVLEAHERVQIQVSSAPSAATVTPAGFGVSAVPDRTVDLRHDFLRQDRARAWHDVDRLSLTLYTGAGDVTVGRQAITWGVSALFPVADLWARFSPFELDTEEKPGIDAVRWLAYPGGRWELDAVVADRGSRDDLSAGLRASLVLPWADLWVGGGKLWREAMVMGGVSAPMGSWKLRGEAVLAWHLDDDGARGWRSGELQPPRVTLGADWLGGGVAVTGEYHYNGVGAPDPRRYPDVLGDPRFARGESYYLGRHYLGGVVTWAPGNDRLSLTLSALANLRDPSTAWTPAATYDLGQSARVSVGGVLTSGTAPDPASLLPVLRSEYGTYGDLGFTRISLYF